MKFADITGDGKADYETICGNIAVSVFSNSNGNLPSWAILNSVPWVLVPPACELSIFNGDGRADFLLLMPDRSVLAFINEGFPKVNYIPNVASGVAPADKIRFADINGDGKADYLVVNDDGSVDAWLNAGGDASGKPGWISMGRIAGGIKAPGKNVQFADIDGDGRADYLLIDPANGAVTAWINNGTDKPF